jgi:hypothetical protein
VPSTSPTERPRGGSGRGWLAVALAALGLLPGGAGAAELSLRFHGNGVEDVDRVKIRVDDPATVAPGPPADIGATDFTLEFWMKATAAENQAPAVSCGTNIAWINGNIVVDRDRFDQDRKFGLSIAGGRLVFGVSGDGTGDATICGTSDVLDGLWHHVALQRRRSDGRLWLYLDGALDAQGDGPAGDVSYPDDGVPGSFCGGPCTNSDPFLVIGAEKHDAGPAFPSFSGWIDEMRLSRVLRYPAPFTRPAAPFVPDGSTVALYHFDEGSGDAVTDSSGAPGGPSHGVRRFGGSPPGPDWSADVPWAATVFADVGPGHFARRHIEAAQAAGVTAGCQTAPLRYCPDAPTTREQMAVFLLRADRPGESPPPCTAPGPFPDVPCASPYAAWIAELARRGITAGCDGARYCPAEPVTREQMAVFVLRTVEAPGYAPPACAPPGPFGDVPCASPYSAWIRELAARAVVTGCGGGLYCPARPVTRAEMAIFLVLAFGLPL